MNLRGVRESGLAWSLPTYGFMGSLLAIMAVGVYKSLQAGGHPIPVEAPAPLPAPIETVSLWLIIRAFASGARDPAMTGVEAVSNGVPIFTDPRESRARGTLRSSVVASVCCSLALAISLESTISVP